MKSLLAILVAVNNEYNAVNTTTATSIPPPIRKRDGPVGGAGGVGPT